MPALPVQARRPLAVRNQHPDGALSPSTRHVERVAVARFLGSRAGNARDSAATAPNNPAYNGQGGHAGAADPQAAALFLPRPPPAVQRVVPQTSVPAGQPSAGPPRICETAFSRTLAGLSGIIVGAGRATNDGGYMSVEATPPGRLDSDVSLITDTGVAATLESGVEL